MTIKHTSTVTNHEISLTDRDANLAAGFLYEVMDKLEPVGGGFDERLAVMSYQAGMALMKALFDAAGIDYTKYDGPTNFLKATDDFKKQIMNDAAKEATNRGKIR